MKTLTFTTKGQSYQTIVDDDDYDFLVSLGPWRLRGGRGMNKYVSCDRKKPAGDDTIMHRIIMKRHGLMKPGKEVDHIDNNKFNNQKANLRLCTRTENSYNKPKNPRLKCSSPYKGVNLSKGSGRWVSYGKIKGKMIVLASFEHERDAAIGYDLFVTKVAPDFAYLNVPDASEEDKTRVRHAINNRPVAGKRSLV